MRNKTNKIGKKPIKNNSIMSRSKSQPKASRYMEGHALESEGKLPGSKPASMLRTSPTAITGNVSAHPVCVNPQICGNQEGLSGFRNPDLTPYFGHSGWRAIGQQFLTVHPCGAPGTRLRTAWSTRVYPGYDRAYRSLVRMVDGVNEGFIRAHLESTVDLLALWWELEQYYVLAEAGIRNSCLVLRAGILGSSDLKAKKDEVARALARAWLPPKLRQYIFWLFRLRTHRDIIGSPIVHFSANTLLYDAPADWITAMDAHLTVLYNVSNSFQAVKMAKIMDSYALTDVPDVTTPNPEEVWSNVFNNAPIQKTATPTYFRRTHVAGTDPVEYYTITNCSSAMDALCFTSYDSTNAIWQPGLLTPTLDATPRTVDDTTGALRAAANLAERSTEAALLGFHNNVDDSAAPGTSYGAIYGGALHFTTPFVHNEQVALMYEELMGVNQFDAAVSAKSITPAGR